LRIAIDSSLAYSGITFNVGNGPAAILMLERDAIVVVGAMVAVELYGLACPVALADRRDWETLAAAASLALEAGPNGAAISADL